MVALGGGEKLKKELGFLGGFGEGEIFAFHSGESDSVCLLARGPRDWGVVVEVDIDVEHRSSGSDAPEASEYPCRGV